MTKKLIFIIAIVLIVGGVGYFYWQQNQTPSETGGSGFSFRSFFPFGNSQDVTNNNSGNSTEETNNSATGNTSGNEQAFITTSPVTKLRKLSESPIAGFVMFDSGPTTTIRFIEKATGNIYEARSDSPTIRRLTNTTIPKISRAFWLPGGDALLAQTVSENDLIETSYLKLKPTPKNATSSEASAPFQVSISKLPTDIQELTVSPDGKKIIYYTKDRGSMWYSSNPDGTGKQNIYQSPIIGWQPQWYSAGSILLTTKATYLAPSYGYTMRSSGSQPIRIFGGEAGGSAKISPDGKMAIISNSEDALVLNAVNLATGAKLSIGSATFADKCTWDPSDINYIICGVPQKAPSGSLPDDWYKGLFSTSDLIERINVNNNVVFIASNPSKEAEAEIDVKEIQVSKNGRYASLIDKSDSSLWLLKIKD